MTSRAAVRAEAARLRALLQLSYLYRELGDLYLASVLARESLELARAEAERLGAAVAPLLPRRGELEEQRRTRRETLARARAERVQAVAELELLSGEEVVR